jgi:hypothetical protein
MVLTAAIRRLDMANKLVKTTKEIKEILVD